MLLPQSAGQYPNDVAITTIQRETTINRATMTEGGEDNL
jgi:hypothetical protein